MPMRAACRLPVARLLGPGGPSASTVREYLYWPSVRAGEPGCGPARTRGWRARSLAIPGTCVCDIYEGEGVARRRVCVTYTLSYGYAGRILEQPAGRYHRGSRQGAGSDPRTCRSTEGVFSLLRAGRTTLFFSRLNPP
eukprot:1949386-Prymnesium_polylepis.2